MNIVCLDGYALNPGDLSWDSVRGLGELTVYDRTPPDQVIPRAAQADAVLTNKTPLPAQILAGLPRLRYVGVLATGYNVVDVQAAKARGIVVTNVPTYGTDSVAQFVFALLLELCHRVGLHSHLVAQGEWSRCPDFCWWRSPQVELAGQTMGVVGAGRIGRRVAELASAFGMTVLLTDVARLAAIPKGCAWADMDDLFARADVVSLHVPFTPQTDKLVNARRLATMKPSAMLINTSRGPVVDEQALRDALLAKRLAGAAVDVLSVEPPPATHPLIGLDNCIVTPHIAWATAQARRRLMDTVAGNLQAFLGGAPVNVVNL